MASKKAFSAPVHIAVGGTPRSGRPSLYRVASKVLWAGNDLDVPAENPLFQRFLMSVPSLSWEIDRFMQNWLLKGGLRTPRREGSQAAARRAPTPPRTIRRVKRPPSV